METAPAETSSLLAQAQAGDAEAFGEICRTYETRLLRHAMALCGQSALTWLCAILLNRYRNTVRGGRAMPLSALTDPERSALETGAGCLGTACRSPDEAALRRDDAALVQRCIATLPAKHQQVIHLRFYVEDSLEGIAAALGCSVGTVKSRLFHALDKLRGMSTLRAQVASITQKVLVL
jgi:RNA polymerase sigma-70 factor (ECF subfamily)